MKRYANGTDVLGRLVRIPRLKTAPFSLANDGFQIVGVVGDARNQGLQRDILPEVLFPYTIAGLADVVVVRTALDPKQMMNALRQQVYAVDKDQPVSDAQTIDPIWMTGCTPSRVFTLCCLGCSPASVWCLRLSAYTV